MESILANLKSWIVFGAVLSVLIIVHEWGHFITARKLGVKVERFSLGFGKKLFSKIHKGTEYLICAIPLGGYVKLAGDERSECQGHPWEFFSKPPGHRALVVLNGPIVNFIFAYICLVLVFFVGYPDLSNKVGQVIDGYPAQEAGLKVNDRIVEVDGMEIMTFSDLQDSISTSQGRSIQVKIIRDDREITKIVFPLVEERKNIFGQTEELRMIGVAPQEEIIAVRHGVIESFVGAFEKLSEIVVTIFKSLYFMITGSVSPQKVLTGPIGIFYYVTEAANMGFAHLLLLLGVISASLATFNLFPIIPLDGGHLLFLLLEKIHGRSLPEKIEEIVARIGFGLILLLAVYVFYADFARFGLFDKIKDLFS